MKPKFKSYTQSLKQDPQFKNARPFKLASEMREEKKQKEPSHSHRIIRWINLPSQIKKSHEQVKIVVDSFYPNGKFDEAKYADWQKRVQKEMKEHLIPKLTDELRCQIRDEMLTKTYHDIARANIEEEQ